LFLLEIGQGFDWRRGECCRGVLGLLHP
jgi:hypothetical protein